MKYNDKNKPLVCMMTQSTCYKGTRKFTPKGVLWHSTGANNPTLKRYVQPDDNASNKAELLALIGKNTLRSSRLWAGSRPRSRLPVKRIARRVCAPT